MLVTEKEAEEKWCPMYRMVCVPEGTLWDNRANNQGYSRCEASGCMAWRWVEAIPREATPTPKEEITSCEECAHEFMVPYEGRDWKQLISESWQCPQCGETQMEVISYPERRRGYCGLAGKVTHQ